MAKAGAPALGLVVLLWLSPSATLANTGFEVDARTGNLSVTAVDHPMGNGTGAPALLRSYNSQARRSGVFGMGWGSLFETRLITFGDGTAAAQDSGYATTSYGVPGGASLTRDSQRIAGLVAAREQLTPAARDYLVLKFNTSPQLRADKTIEHGLHNVPLALHPLSTPACEAGRLQPMRTFYLRTTCDGWEERFDMDGRLTARGRPGAAPVTLERHPDGTQMLRTTATQDSWRLDRGANGLIQQASTPDGARYTYTYDASGNLTAVEGGGVAGTLRYGYGPDHLLTAIHHPDGRVYRFEYRMDRRVAKITEPSGQVVRYDYLRGSREERDLEKTVVTQQGADGEPQEDRAIERAWNGRSGKLLRYRDAQGWHRFEYSHQGLLRTAYSSFGDAALAYDTAGNMGRLRVRMPGEEAIQELVVEYGDDRQPLRIELVGLGVVPVQRDVRGEVAAVHAEGQHNDEGLASRLMHLLSAFRRIVMHADVRALL